MQFNACAKMVTTGTGRGRPGQANRRNLTPLQIDIIYILVQHHRQLPGWLAP
jgi:hypothetical protein